jgi:hypothetical protein
MFGEDLSPRVGLSREVWRRGRRGSRNQGEGDEHADGGAEEPASISAGECVAGGVAAADERFGLCGGKGGEHRKADRRRQLLRGVEQAGGEAGVFNPPVGLISRAGRD